jgi:MFS family permease
MQPDKANVTSGESQATNPASSTPLILDYRSPSAQRWVAGTLTYSTLGLVMVFFWLLLGVAGTGLRERAYPTAVTVILRQEFKASDTAVAFFMTFLAQGMMMTLGPVLGYWSDRHRGRWGRRIPFLAVATPVSVLAMFGMALTPQIAARVHVVLGAHSPGITWCGLIVFGVFWVFFQATIVCVFNLFPALCNDVVPRPLLGRFFAMFRAVSLLCGMTYNLLLIGHVEAHFQWIFIAMALWFGVTFALMLLVVREGEYPPVEQIHGGDIGAGAAIMSSVKLYFHECLKNPYYVWVFAALALGALTAVPVNTFSVLYAKKLGLPLASYGRWIATNHMCGFLLAYPLGMLVDRFHSLRVSMVTIGCYGLTMLLGGIVIQGPLSFGWAVFFQALISGTYLTASMSLPQALLPRLKFGQFYSASTLLTSIVIMFFSLALGRTLDYTGSNYRLTYFIGFGLAMITVAVMAVVYRKFMAFGGPKGYVAPD